MKNENYFIGLDIGTESVGYAVTDTTENYNLLKFKGQPMWGVTLFDEPETKAKRRGFRSARRRLDRRQQRVKLVQEIFAKEIAEKDEKFYHRIKESYLLREDKDSLYCLFEDSDYKDADYHKQYPTIHHLIMELIDNKQKHDIRLIYLACAWLVAHRGHFLNEISEDNLSAITDFTKTYNNLMQYFENLPVEEDYCAPWSIDNIDEFADIVRKKDRVGAKEKKFADLLFDGKKPPKKIEHPENFPFSIEGIIKLISGGSVKLKDLYGKSEYEEFGSFSLDKTDEDYQQKASELGDDFELLLRLKEIFDWGILADLLKGRGDILISQVKIDIYNKHQQDLKFLKYFIRKYKGKKEYNDIFRNANVKNNYVAYSGNIKSATGDLSKFEKCYKKEDFCKFISEKVKETEVEDVDIEKYNDMINRLDKNSLSFLPKQVDGDNRVIPYQLYYVELKKILENASAYFPFINEKDEDGYSAKDKILSVMKFRIPYYVGPLNSKEYGWMQRKAEGKIYPWNFEEKVDLDKSEYEFINRMTNVCSYLPGEDVLPKHSLLYEKHEVLNEINNIKIMGRKIPVEVKQRIYNEIFMSRKKVTVKMIKSFLIANNYCTKEDAETLSGVDITIKSSLSSYHAFKNLLENNIISYEDAEKIIERHTYSENKYRFRKWLEAEFNNISDEDRRYISSLSFKEFGRLSAKLLNGFEGANKETGELATVMNFLWNTNDNLSEILLSDNKYDFRKKIQNFTKEYYSSHSKTLDERFDEMYLSTSVRRPIKRTFEIIKDIEKAIGKAPEKIFIEMAKGGKEDEKGKRKLSRKEQILNFYQKVKNEDVKRLKAQLEAMGDSANNRLQSESLFLYYMQLGKCMYSGKTIDIAKLSDGTYNVDHIYPRAKCKDDSILKNKVLVCSEDNGEKGDKYPIKAEIRNKMYSFWKMLKESELISDEKFKRLIRNTPFSDDEKWGFINRQLVETMQSTKAVAELMKEKYPDTEIVYVKANNVSEFRQNNKLIKSRVVNDLHHAKDAYLNIVVGNVYNKFFTEKWFISNKDSDYSINQKVLMGKPRFSGEICFWNGGKSLKSVIKTMHGNKIHVVPYAFCRQGGLFDQLPLKAKEGLIPRKAGLDTAKYGGYNKSTVAYYILVKFKIGAKYEVMLVPVELMFADKIKQNNNSLTDYISDRIKRINGKQAEDITYPLGKRPIKINTVFSLDGFLCILSGASSGGKCLIMAPFMMLTLSQESEQYIKRLESFCEKCKNNESYLYSEKYDKISAKENIELYDVLLDKYKNTIYSKRPNAPVETIEIGRDTFISLNIKDQSSVLLNIIGTFGRVSGGSDLSLINGASHAAATVSFSALLKNWQKSYKSAYIIDVSPSGIREKKSENLLELL